MEQLTVEEASRDFTSLVDRVVKSGVTVELMRDDLPVARIIPAVSKRGATMEELAAVLNSLSSLGDDAEAFARDVEEGRKGFLPEKDHWGS
ncbi:MAG: hypothetical protein AABP62_12785 [Planctomycetota bacterium]